MSGQVIEEAHFHWSLNECNSLQYFCWGKNPLLHLLHQFSRKSIHLQTIKQCLAAPRWSIIFAAGSNVEANTIYEGAPASAKDIESGPGAGEIRYKKGDG